MFAKVDLDSDSDSEDADANDEEEALVLAQYIEACDVYSMGVLVWEVETGEEPWAKEIAKWSKKIAGSGAGSDQIKQQLARTVYQKEKRPKVPAGCSPLITSIIERCWHQDAAQRPAVEMVLGELEGSKELADIAPAFPGGRHLQGSNFKIEYEKLGDTSPSKLQPHQQGRLLHAVESLVEKSCEDSPFDAPHGAAFVQVGSIYTNNQICEGS
jgi:hypothetical protein